MTEEELKAFVDFIVEQGELRKKELLTPEYKDMEKEGRVIDLSKYRGDNDH